MNIIISILVFIVVLMIIVLVHEFGHFFSAKRFGIRVDEFGFGFPPKIASFKKGETEYSLNALPFGGFVRIYGQGMDETEVLKGNFTNETQKIDPDSSRSFENKPKWQQAIVLMAGIFANFMLAWILIISLYTAGTHIIFDDTLPSRYMQDAHLVVAGVSAETPASEAKLQVGDIISNLYFPDQSKNLSFVTPEKLIDFIQNSGGKPIDFNIIRNGKSMVIEVTPKKQKSNFFIGISPSFEGYIKLPFFSAIIQGFHSSFAIVKETIVGIGKLFIGKESLDSISGPVGMVGIVGSALKIGFQYLIVFTALISISLAVINLVPFPALDGGRLLFVLIEKIKGSRLNAKFANYANMIGFGILILLMIVITLHDIIKLF